MIEEFVIDSKLPSLNDFIKANRSNLYQGNKFKRNVETLIGLYIKKAMRNKKLHPKEYAVIVYFEWHEKTKKRDADNIASAKKFILDALQKCGVLINDSRKYVVGFHDTIIDDKKDFVVVRLMDYKQFEEMIENCYHYGVIFDSSLVKKTTSIYNYNTHKLEIGKYKETITNIITSLNQRKDKPGQWLQWMNLGYNEETVWYVKEFASMVKGRFDNVVVLGLGGSALGGLAVTEALLKPYWNLLTKEQREGFPRIFFLDKPAARRFIGINEL